jgi:hypothetical protein
MLHAIVMVALATTMGCSGASNNDSPPSDGAEAAMNGEQANSADPGAMDEVDRAVAVAKEIMRAPESADDILARYDLDREGLDELIYKIAADASLRQRYSEQLTARE